MSITREDLCNVVYCETIRYNNATVYCSRHRRSYIRYGDAERCDKIRKIVSLRTELRESPAGQSYRAMIDRCLNPNSVTYMYYGGRGIKICERWLGEDGLANFIEDMGHRPDGMTLDKLDNDKGYSKENCRWATFQQQAFNKRDWGKRGFRGVSKARNKYLASLIVGGVRVLHKTYSSFDAAMLARLNAKSIYESKVFGQYEK